MAKKIQVVPTYLKLGEKAQIFHCPVTQLTISNTQVVKIDRVHLQKPSIKQGLKSGHIVLSNEEEWQTAKDETARINKEARKFAPKRKKVVEVEEDINQTEDELNDDDDDNDDGGDDDDDDNEEPTKSEMIDAIKASDAIDPAKKKGLTKLSDEELKELYDQTKQQE